MRRKRDGLLVTEISTGDDTERVIISREVVNFDKAREEEYLEKFKTFKSQGIIENNSFYDNVWTLARNEYGQLKRNNVVFIFGQTPIISTSLRFYCIDKLTNKIDIGAIFTNIDYISNMLYESNNFCIDNYTDFEDYVFSLSAIQQTKFKDAAWEYISYVKQEIPSDYEELLSRLRNVDGQTRILPDYRSILYFDYFVQKFIEEASSALKYKYYPILLWWIITSIIPMRPVEFTILKKNGCFERDGEYFLEVTRVKPHSYISKALNIRKTQVIKVTESVYKMIVEYVGLDGHEGNYLLSYNLLKKLRLKNSMRGNYELIPLYSLNNLLDEFYNEVILGMYEFESESKKDAEKENRTINKTTGHKIVKLQLGDTRHLAIINLVKQGCDPYTVKELAGQDDINSHSHYYNHVEKFVESQVLLLTDKIREEIKMLDSNARPPRLANRRAEKSTHLLMNTINDDSGVIKVDRGYCFEYKGRMELYPSLCISICKECTSLIRNVEQLNEQSLDIELKEAQNQIEKEISIIKFYMIESVKRRLIDSKSGKFNVESKRILKTASNKLNNLIIKKSKIQAYKLIINEVNDK